MPELNRDNLSVIAESITTLTYAEMMELGESLSYIFTNNSRFDATDRDDWASLLYSWAEIYGEDQE